MNSLRGKFGSYSTSTSRTNSTDISKLSLRELMAEEFPVDPFVSGRKLLPHPVSKPFINDEPRRPQNREYPLFDQRDRGVLSMTEYVNSVHETSRREDPRRYGDYFSQERPYPDREFKRMNNSQFVDTYSSSYNGEFKGMNNSQFVDTSSSYYNGAQHRNSEQEQFRPYGRQGIHKQASEDLNLSECVNRFFTTGESSNLFATNTRNEKNKAVKDLLVVEDTAAAEIPNYVKDLLAKVLSRDKTIKKESAVTSVKREDNQSQSENKSDKTDLAEYVQMLYARIESDREKIVKYEDLLKQGIANELNIKSEENLKEAPSTQSSEIDIKQPSELSSEKDKSSEKSKGNVATAQPADSELAMDVESSSESIEIIEEVAPVKPSLPRPPEFPSLTEAVLQHKRVLENSSRDYYQHRRRLTSKSPTKSRSRSPRRYRMKSPGRVSKSPPRRVRSRSPKGFRDRSRSPNKPKTSSNSSNNLVGALKLIISAIKRTNTDYSLDMLQDNISVDFFHLPSPLKASLLVCGFQVKLSTSSSAHGYHWTMLRDVLEFSQGCNLNHEVYVEANAHDDSVDIHDTKAYELAEYFRDTDVTIDFQTLDKNLVKEYQLTHQSNPWAHLHPTQNIPGPSRPNIFNRLGNWS